MLIVVALFLTLKQINLSVVNENRTRYIVPIVHHLSICMYVLRDHTLAYGHCEVHVLVVCPQFENMIKQEVQGLYAELFSFFCVF